MGLVALIYWPVASYDFVPLDDPSYVSSNPHVADGLTWQGIAWAFTSRWAAYWIPLTWISYMAEVQVFGLDPGVHHVTNVVLHAANTLILLAWLWQATGRIGRSAFVAAVFAVHPLHVESVAWITERKDVLSTFFLLLALVAYTAYIRRRTAARYLLLCVCFIAGLLSKPMLVTLPFVLILCDVWPLERASFRFATREDRARWRAVFMEKWPLFVIAGVLSAVAFVTQDRGGAMKAHEIFPLELRVANALVSYVQYLWQTIWPVRLVVLYPYPESIPIWRAAAALALLSGISVLAWRSAGRRPWLMVGWCWFVGTLVPVIGLVQVGLQPRADRFMYVPMIGLLIALAWTLGPIVMKPARPFWKPFATVGAIGIVLICTAASRRQVEHWRDGGTLWQHAVDATPPGDAFQARYELATFVMGQGRTAEAIGHLREAIRIRPGFTGAHAALGVALERSGQTVDAEAAYSAALRLDPDLPEIHNNLGAILANGGRIAEALPHFQHAARLRPDLESARVNLGVVLVRLGRREEAIKELSAALQINPSNQQARHVLDLLTKPGK